MAKDIKVEICVCTECVMQGAMDLMESVESLKKLKSELKFDGNILVSMNKCIGEKKHGEKCLLASVNGEVIEQANSETVMEKVISIIKKDGE